MSSQAPEETVELLDRKAAEEFIAEVEDDDPELAALLRVEEIGLGLGLRPGTS